jgi:uncharacterized protein YcgL (UPF0745 family)
MFALHHPPKKKNTQGNIMGSEQDFASVPTIFLLHFGNDKHFIVLVTIQLLLNSNVNK